LIELNASFLSAFVPILMQPTHTLYLHVVKLFKRVRGTVQTIPLFYDILLTDMENSHNARTWLFNVIRRGLNKGGVRTASLLLENAIACGDGLCGDKVVMATNDDRASLILRNLKVIQWLTGVASSAEMANPQVWSAAADCLGAALADLNTWFVATALFDVPSWVATEALRVWPGDLGLSLRHTALSVLTQILHKLLFWHVAGHNRGGDFDTHVLKIGNAVEAVARGWVAVVAGRSDSDQPIDVPVVSIWVLLYRMSVIFLRHEGEGTSGAQQALGMQVGNIVQQFVYLLDTETEDHQNGTLHVARVLGEKLGNETAFGQILTLLRISPLNAGLHDLATYFARWRSDGLLNQGISSRERGEAVRLALQAMLAAVVQSGNLDVALQKRLTPLVWLLAGLPFCAVVLWRKNIIACSLLLVLHPSAIVDAELLKQLPPPEAAVASTEGGGEEEVRVAEQRSATILEVLGALSMAVSMHFI